VKDKLMVERLVEKKDKQKVEALADYLEFD
jgi:hypothetical protein